MPRRAPPELARALLAVLALGACRSEARRRPSPGEVAIHVVDAAGVTHDLDVAASRIVSLVPSATLTLHALGADSLLVGRTDFDTASWATAVPSVGGGIGPSLETLISLEPDVVIRFAGEQDPRTAASLDAAGIRHVAVRPDRIEDVRSEVRILGKVTGHERAADSLLADIDRELAAVARSVEGLPVVRVAYVLGGTPPWVAGPDTYIDEIIRLVGGVNVFADLGSLYAPVSPEALASRPIDVVLVSGRATFDAAVRAGARFEEVGALLELPGPDVAREARRVAELVHPELGS